MKKCARRRPPGDGTRLGEPVCRVFGTPSEGARNVPDRARDAAAVPVRPRSRGAVHARVRVGERWAPPPCPSARGRGGGTCACPAGSREASPPCPSAPRRYAGCAPAKRQLALPRSATGRARRSAGAPVRARRFRWRPVTSEDSGRAFLEINGGNGRPEDRESHRPRLPKLLAAEEVDDRRRHEMPARKPLRR